MDELLHGIILTKLKEFLNRHVRLALQDPHVHLVRHVLQDRVALLVHLALVEDGHRFHFMNGYNSEIWQHNGNRKSDAPNLTDNRDNRDTTSDKT